MERASVSFTRRARNEKNPKTMASYIQLEGTPPERFDGDRAKTRIVLMFVLMNEDAAIVRDALKRCAYFISLD